MSGYVVMASSQKMEPRANTTRICIHLVLIPYALEKVIDSFILLIAIKD